MSQWASIHLMQYVPESSRAYYLFRCYIMVLTDLVWSARSVNYSFIFWQTAIHRFYYSLGTFSDQVISETHTSILAWLSLEIQAMPEWGECWVWALGWLHPALWVTLWIESWRSVVGPASCQSAPESEIRQCRYTTGEQQTYYVVNSVE